MPETPETKTPADLLAEIRETLGAALHRIDSARAEIACGIAPDLGAVISALERAETQMDDLDEALA